MVSLGGPLRWDAVHPVVRAVLASPWLVGMIPIRGARLGARLAMPLIKRMPGVAALYLNASEVDLEAAQQLVQTVENPSRRLNRQIAQWIKDRDLCVDGLNITDALRGRDLPLLCVVANADGVVPPAAVLSATDPMPAADVLRVGDDDVWFAHADLFVGRTAPQRVFSPLAEWLEANSRP
jgi:pimeloyl-ACP methyl ester carboxylesterase